MALTVLKKALPQSRYIKIGSTNVGNAEISDRDFGGLIFTETATFADGTAFSDDKMVEVYTADQAMAYFGSEAIETDIASQYFGYRSPRGFSPRRLCFVRKLTTETPKEAIVRVNGLSNNFGGFMFAQTATCTVAQMKDVVEYVDSLDYKYLFSVSFPSSVTANDSAASGDALIGETNARDFVINLANGASLPTYSGTCVWLGRTKNEDDEGAETPVHYEVAAFMPLAILGAVRYSGTNTVTNYMYKQFKSQQYTVDDALEADAYDAKCVNYIGLVQANGPRKSFSQQGFNINGTATNVYCNELWLKSEVETSVLNLFLEAEIVSADEDGELLLFNTISSCAVKARDNGAISVGKTLDDDQKTRIYQLTNDPDAWRTVQNAGYTLSVTMERTTRDGKTYYTAYYRLVYSKDDAILKVEGQHALV